MKKLKLFLPTLALAFAIVATFASPDSAYLADPAKGINSKEQCVLDLLYENRTLGQSSGQCFRQDDGIGVCIVTFTGKSPTTACHPHYTRWLRACKRTL